MTPDIDAKKRHAALRRAGTGRRAGATIGVGTGSTVNLFIEALAPHPGRVRAAVSSSEASSARLRAAGIEVARSQRASPACDLYIDGADEANPARQLIKGGGGALTREKIVAAAARALRVHRR